MGIWNQEPRATFTRDQALLIESPYTPALIRRMDKAIPRGAHRYNRRFRRWVIDPDWAPVALGIFRALFPDGIIIDWRGAR